MNRLLTFSHIAPCTIGLASNVDSHGHVEYPRKLLAPTIGAANNLQENSRTEIRALILRFTGSTIFRTKRKN